MTNEIPGVAEKLAREFAHVPPMVVMQAVCACAGECESASPLFVEQAARACLKEQNLQDRGPTVPEQRS